MTAEEVMVELDRLDGKDTLAVAAREGRLLHKLVRRRQPKTVLEIGTGHGYSTVWMSLAMNPDAVLYTIDEIPRPHLFEIDFAPVCGRIRFLKGTLDELYGEIPDHLDMAFLDSQHHIDKITWDAETVEHNLEPGGLIAVHDTEYLPEMGRCLRDYFRGIDSDHLKKVEIKPSQGRWRYHGIKTQFGLGLAVKLERNGS